MVKRSCRPCLTLIGARVWHFSVVRQHARIWTLECREVANAKDIPLRILPCRVQHIERVASDVIILSLKLPTNERLQFLPGQYIEFLLKDGKRRAFSIANAPHQDELLTLHIRRVDGGSFTTHVFEVMKEKEILRFQGPMGTSLSA